MSDLDSSVDGRGEPALLLVGVDHRTAPLALRERLAYHGADSEALLVNLAARPEIAEALLVSTCNRTEVYVRPQPGQEAYRAVFDLAFGDRAPEVEEQGRFFAHRGADAARHLLAVAAGLESMVLGEPEILGQVKQSVALAESLGTSGPVLRRLARTAIAAGGRARAETAVGAGAVSLGYAVVELSRNIFRGVDNLTVLILGAGETAELVARSLPERRPGKLRVANRGAERAREFQEKHPQAEILPLDARFDALRSADVVVTTTSAPEPLITRRDLADAMPARQSRPLLIVDLGVPRNVEPDGGKVANVFLHTLDSLQTLIERNLERRREEVPKVDAIVAAELALFRAWHRGLVAEPVVAQLQKRAEEIRQREVAQVRDRFPAALHDELDRLTRSLTRKLLHHPSHRLRQANGGEDLFRVELVRDLFQLEEQEQQQEREEPDEPAPPRREQHA